MILVLGWLTASSQRTSTEPPATHPDTYTPSEDGIIRPENFSSTVASSSSTGDALVDKNGVQLFVDMAAFEEQQQKWEAEYHRLSAVDPASISPDDKRRLDELQIGLFSSERGTVSGDQWAEPPTSEFDMRNFVVAGRS